MSKSNRRLLRKRQAQSSKDKENARLTKMNNYWRNIIKDPPYIEERFTEDLLYSVGIEKKTK